MSTRIFELPEPYLGQTHGNITSVEDGLDTHRSDPFLRLLIPVGTMEGQAFHAAPIPAIRRWIRGPELEAFLARQERLYGHREWRMPDLIHHVRTYGLDSKYRVDADVIRMDEEPAATEPEKRTLWQKMNTPIGDLIRGK